MTIITVNGSVETQLDGTQRVIAPNSSTWADLSGITWDTWRSYTGEPSDTLTWLTLPLDLTSQSFFTVTTTADIAGNVTYYVYTSSTGVFGGEETTEVITPGDENIFGFYGRYVMIGISVEYDPAQGQPAINAFDFVASGKFLTLLVSDQDSSTLDSFGSAKVLTVPQAVSRIFNAQITTHISEDYIVDDYIAVNYFETGTTAYASIVSKNRNDIHIKFTNAGGNVTNTVFDAVVYALPELYMNGNNLSLR